MPIGFAYINHMQNPRDKLAPLGLWLSAQTHNKCCYFILIGGLKRSNTCRDGTLCPQEFLRGHPKPS